MKNVIQSKSFDFAVRIVKLCRHLAENKKERVLSKQLLRSGTSIGANIEEAIGGTSRSDFANKLAIAYKEARETSYWLRLLAKTDYLTQKQFSSIHADTEELLKLLFSIRKTTKSSR